MRCGKENQKLPVQVCIFQIWLVFLKLYKYRFAGVREYWIIDPQNRKIQVYDLEHDSFAETYRFTDKIPLLISAGKCTVDFSMIDKAVQRYYEAD